MDITALRARLRSGLVIPALPLALDADRRFDERHQRAVLRYYLDAGVGGIAVGVHSTQFAIRDPAVGLYAPLLAFAAEEMRRRQPEALRIAGVCGRTAQALGEVDVAVANGYDAVLLSLVAMGDAPERDVLAHVRAVAQRIPVVGFYLQRAVGGRRFSYAFWRDFAAIPGVVAVKIAPFDRYGTLDVVRAVVDAGRRDEVVLYTGNDDAIVADLLTPFRFAADQEPLFIAGGLLGHWGVWTRAAVGLLDEIKALRAGGGPIPLSWWTRAAEVTDMNAAVFDTANGFHGCIPGIHEVLRRQGLLAGNWCIDPSEVLSPGQTAELDRVTAAYPHLVDTDFVAANIGRWLEG